MKQENLDQFLRDADDFRDELSRVLARMEKEPADRDLVHRAFRLVHSLKSESQLLEAAEVSAVAEEMEGVLTQIREGTLAVGAESLGILNPLLGALEEVLSVLAKTRPPSEQTGSASMPVPDAASRAPASLPNVTQPSSRSAGSIRGSGRVPAWGRGGLSLPHFTDFETQLIGEAMGRGERLYRLHCEIEESAPLKYPKAYLIVSNLELATNVIRSVPTFETTEDEAFRDFTVYLTAGIGEAKIRETVDVDQVESVEISEIPYRLLEEAGEVAPPARTLPLARRGPSSVRVENGRMDEISRKLRDLGEAVERLHRTAAGQESTGEVGNSAATLSERLHHLHRLVNETREVPIAEEFRHIPWLVRDLAARLGKQARMVATGEELCIDRRLASMLSEPLVHLVRNAVDHGIETPSERVAEGKDPEGTILISAVQRGDEFLLQVGDDGRGISLPVVTRRADELGIAPKDVGAGFAFGAGSSEEYSGPDGLLSLLIQPGFSTRREPTAVSGRGVGLDAIYQKVRQSLGGGLRLQTQVGNGALFTISIPGASTMMSILMVRSGRHTVGIALRDVISVEETGSGTFRLADDGFLSYKRLPLYAVAGRLTPSEVAGATYQVVSVGRNGKPFAFMSDELLFERDLPEKNMSLGESVVPGLRRVSIGEVGADFLFLDVADIE